MKLLHIESSILAGQSASRQISATVVARLRDLHPGIEVKTRDLAATPLPHFDLSNLPDSHPIAGTLDPAVKAETASARAQSQDLLDEFLAADIVVIGAPVYNFTMPSQLKAWIDRILIPGKTFAYDASGPRGLAGGKRVVAVVARGGFYGQGAPAAAAEHLETYLRTVFGFMGVTDFEVIVAEGIAAGPDHRASALERAETAARDLKAA